MTNLFTAANLLEILENNPENEVREMLNSFSCEKNSDVENFLRHKAINFAKQRLASVWLVLAPHGDSSVIVGYFALTQKFFKADLQALSANMRRRIEKFINFFDDTESGILIAPLIGQLGKNYTDNFDKLITGDELLNTACETVKEGQRIFGGRLVYLECADSPKLIEFYERNGFVKFGSRIIEDREKAEFEGKYLIQLLKYLD